jgi:hypothetical protein
MTKDKGQGAYSRQGGSKLFLVEMKWMEMPTADQDAERD